VAASFQQHCMYTHKFNLLLIRSVCFYSLPLFHALPLRSSFFYYSLIYFSFSFFLLTPYFDLFFISPLFTIYLFTYLFIHLYLYFFQFSRLSCFLPFFLPFSLRNLELHIYMWLITSDLSITDTALICGLCEPHILPPLL
jgi:signal transduction histidine kinase